MKFFLGFLIALSQQVLYSQNMQLFNYLETDNSSVTIDLFKEIKEADSNRIQIFGFIKDKTLDVKNVKPKMEGWLNSYSSEKFDMNFYIFDLKKIEKFSVSFKSQNRIDTLSRLQCFAIIYIQDPQLVKNIKNNSLKLNTFYKEHLSFKDREDKTYHAFILESDSFEDFQWKFNQLQYNLENFEIPIAPKIEVQKNLFFEMNASTSILNVNTKGFNGFSTKDLNINVLHTFKESSLSVGAGISYMQSNFFASDNATYNSTNSLILDTTYAAINNLTQNYAQQIISLNGLVRISPKIGENNLSISISPFISIYNRLTTEISGGSITTYGKYDGISEYVYNVDELGLFSKSEELVGQRIDFNTSAYGINLGIGYQMNLKHFHIVPTLSVKYLSIQNKNNIKDSYSIDSQSYFGKFATLPKTSFISPLIGLSIIF